jgi:inositol oxygenase
MKVTKNNVLNEFRDYSKNENIYNFYKEQHINQTYEFVQDKIKEYSKFNKDKLSIHEMLEMMDMFVDPSDPDIDLPNSIHAYQTAERIRLKHPENYSLQITGLIHDLGKILFKFGEPSWSVVGDTFVVGCKYSKNIVHFDTLKENPDYTNLKYNTELGIYTKNCGLKNLLFSFGHDEYLYMVLKNSNCKLEDKYLDIIRYHSFYPWHSHNDYQYLMSEEDYKVLKDVQYFNSFDLYSKNDDTNITNEIKNYYKNLLSEFFPDKILL